MFKLDRRRMLLGLAAASTTAAGSAAAPSPAENPELIRLGDALPPIAAAYFAAADHKEEVRKAADAVWPSAPDEMTGVGGVYERCIGGAVIPSKSKTLNPGNARIIGTVEELEKNIRNEEMQRAHILTTKSKRGLRGCEAWLAEYRAALPAAKKYWADVEAVKARFPYKAATDAHAKALADFSAHIGAILSAEERTMAGVVIKAQALAEWGKVGKFWRGFNAEGVDWPSQLADAIVRQAEG